MAIEKPLPMQIGNTYYYTLSSYDPVDIEVTVMNVTDADIDFAFSSLVVEHKGDPNTVDDAWSKEHFDGLTLAELRSALRQQLEQAASERAEQEKAIRCTEVLAQRLQQSVPQNVLRSYESNLSYLATEELRQAGSSIDEPSKLDEDLMQGIQIQARALAERDAALDAYANKKKLTLDDSEIAGLMYLSQEDYQELIEKLPSQNDMQYIRESALREKVRRVLVAECKCNYHHETAEEAAKRAEALAKLAELASAAPEDAQS